ncbi:AAA family ATPase [Pyruvatibacter mobilis]|uniref:AAA family ATPase n=1 Tax=Pyruvatibacter mobilis TaxID=1712261 RepID=UPI003BAC59F1
MTADHIRDPAASNVQVTLARLNKLKHVNALREGEVLSFQKTGLTIIYGDNGAGKSGYARVLKQACRARLPRGDVILPNVYGDGSGTPQAEIVFRVGGQSRTFAWHQGIAADPTLTAVSVFDSRTANVHVDATNELAYTPAPLKIMAGLADACLALKTKLASEIENLRDQTPAVVNEPECAPNTAVGKLLTKLSATTNPQTVEDLAGLSDTEAAELRALESDLIADPAKVVRTLKTTKTTIEAFEDKVRSLASAVQQQQIDELIGLKSALDAAKEAAGLASSDLFSGEPLPDVGSDIWRALWEAARGYSKGAAYPGKDFPVTEDNARCVLCHQELTPEASARLTSFESFVRDASKQREETAKQAYEAKLGELSDHQLSAAEIAKVVTTIRDDLEDDTVAERLRRVALENAWRLRAVLKKHTEQPDGEWPEAQQLGPEVLSGVLDRLSDRISGLTAEADSPERQIMISRRDELAGRKWLGVVKADVLAQITRLKAIAEIEMAQKTTVTNRITALSTDLAKTLVTTRLRARFAQEIDKLGVAGLAIELKQAKSAAGVPFFHVRFMSKPDEPVGKVLSEGEHRCVALAAFLAELATTDTASAIVFDDPVSSLDHVHRDKVAERLANESQNRQVVVFTHDIAFLVLIEEACRATQTRSAIPLGYRLVSRGPDAAGFCHDDPPANVLPVEKVVGQMRKHLANVKFHHDRGDQVNWRREVRSFETDLREAWERAVEATVSPVIKRLSQKVQTDGLVRLTVLEKSDCDTMRDAYGRCSKLIHSQPGELNPKLPTPDDIEKEITVLEDWAVSVQSRQEQVA